MHVSAGFPDFEIIPLFYPLGNWSPSFRAFVQSIDVVRGSFSTRPAAPADAATPALPLLYRLVLTKSTPLHPFLLPLFHIILWAKLRSLPHQ